MDKLIITIIFIFNIISFGCIYLLVVSSQNQSSKIESKEAETNHLIVPSVPSGYGTPDRLDSTGAR